MPPRDHDQNEAHHSVCQLVADGRQVCLTARMPSDNIIGGGDGHVQHFLLEN